MEASRVSDPLPALLRLLSLQTSFFPSFEEGLDPVYKTRLFKLSFKLLFSLFFFPKLKVRLKLPPAVFRTLF